MNCTHPVLYMNTRDGSMRCHICGAVIDPQAQVKPPDAAAEAATNDFERPSGRKIGFDAEKPKRTRNIKAD